MRAHSSRVEKRILRVRKLHEEQKNREKQGTPPPPSRKEKIPLWKRRQAEREQGYPEHRSRKKRTRDA